MTRTQEKIHSFYDISTSNGMIQALTINALHDTRINIVHELETTETFPTKHIGSRAFYPHVPTVT